MIGFLCCLEAVLCLVVIAGVLSRADHAEPAPHLKLSSVVRYLHTPHEADIAKLHEVIERFLQRDLFDALWVSWTDDQRSGIVLHSGEGVPKLWVSFQPGPDPSQIDSFAKAMACLGLAPGDSARAMPPSFVAEEGQASLEYVLADSTDSISLAIKAALTNLSGIPPERYFVVGFLAARRPKIRLRAGLFQDIDPLDELFARWKD